MRRFLSTKSREQPKSLLLFCGLPNRPDCCRSRDVPAPPTASEPRRPNVTATRFGVQEAKKPSPAELRSQRTPRKRLERDFSPLGVPVTATHVASWQHACPGTADRDTSPLCPAPAIHEDSPAPREPRDGQSDHTHGKARRSPAATRPGSGTRRAPAWERVRARRQLRSAPPGLPQTPALPSAPPRGPAALLPAAPAALPSAPRTRVGAPTLSRAGQRDRAAAGAPGRVPAPRRGGGGAGARPWGWGLALGLALGVRAAPEGDESESGREEKPPLPRGFGAAVERSRDLVRRIKDEAGIPGILVGVSVDGKEVWSEGLGYADVENRVVCKPETIMRIASISKCLTMMAVAKLWEEGKLDLDAPVQKYVPEFPEKVYEGEKVTITTRLLVSHLSGIRHYEKDITKVKEEKEKAKRALKLTKSHQDKEQKEKEGKGIEKTDCVKQKKEHDGETKSRNSKPGRKDMEFEQEEYYLKEKFDSVIESLKLFKNDPLFFKPGSQFLYSTYGFTLLSAVVERASGQKFTDYMLKMFRDLDMLSTVLDDNEAMIYNRARCYVYNKKGRLVNAPYVDNSYKWAGGGFLSSVGDLLKFGNALLYSYQAGQFKNRNGKLLPGYLKPGTVAMMWTPVPKTEVSWDRDGKYAMAWAVVEKNQQYGCCRQQRHYASHTGGAVGASSVLLILPEELDPEALGTWPAAPPRGVIVTIICNMQSVSLNSTALKIAREFDKEKRAQYTD